MKKALFNHMSFLMHLGLAKRREAVAKASKLFLLVLVASILSSCVTDSPSITDGRVVEQGGAASESKGLAGKSAPLSQSQTGSPQTGSPQIGSQYPGSKSQTGEEKKDLPGHSEKQVKTRSPEVVTNVPVTNSSSKAEAEKKTEARPLDSGASKIVSGSAVSSEKGANAEKQQDREKGVITNSADSALSAQSIVKEPPSSNATVASIAKAQTSPLSVKEAAATADVVVPDQEKTVKESLTSSAPLVVVEEPLPQVEQSTKGAQGAGITQENATLAAEAITLPADNLPLEDALAKRVETPEVSDAEAATDLTLKAEPMSSGVLQQDLGNSVQEAESGGNEKETPQTVSGSVTEDIPQTAKGISKVEHESRQIRGNVSIDFGTRMPGVELSQASDRYTFNLLVDKLISVRGSIVRKPRLVSRYLGREKQREELSFNLGFVDIASKGSKKIASWTGSVEIGKDGLYSLGGGAGGDYSKTLRIVLEKGMPMVVGSLQFGGSIKGRAADRKGAIGAMMRTYTRVIGGRKVSIQSRKVDPLAFNDLVLAAGPVASIPLARVSGNLDYDYDTGNWLTEGIQLRYLQNSQEQRDVVTGSIKWEEDPERAVNGKGRYEFNLRWNEARFAGTEGEEAFFAPASDEEAFFAVDPRIPRISGNVSYVDTLRQIEGGDPIVLSSQLNYRLEASGLRDDQIISFLKIWLLITGPMNDD